MYPFIFYGFRRQKCKAPSVKQGCTQTEQFTEESVIDWWSRLLTERVFMKFPFEKRLGETAKKSLLGTVILWIFVVVWEGVVHQFYSWLNPQVIGVLSPVRSFVASAAQWSMLHPSWLLILGLAPFLVLFALSLLVPKGPPSVEIDRK